MPYYISQQPTNPVMRVLAALFAVIAFVGAFFFGLIIVAVVAGLGLLFFLGLRLRMWWLMRNRPSGPSQTTTRSAESQVIDAEYTVVSKRQDP